MKCPGCSQPFGITASGEHLVEEILITSFEDLYGDVKPAGKEDSGELPPRTSTAAEPAVPRRKTRGDAKPSRSDAKPARAVREPFHMSRSFVVLALSLSGAFFALVVGGWYMDQVTTLNRKASQASELLKTKNERFLKGMLNEKKPQAKGVAVMDDRTYAPAAKQIGSVSVSVFGAQVGALTTKSNRTVPGIYLMLTVRITNLSLADFKYKGWDKGVILRDALGNHYNRIVMDPNDPFAGASGPKTVPNATTISDVLIFETPAESRELELDLPQFSDGESAYQFRLPLFFVKRSMMSNFTMPVSPPPVPPVPPDPRASLPPPALQQQDDEARLRADILSDWKEGIAKIDRTSKGMTTNDARRFRIKGREQLVEKLAKKYRISDTMVRRIVPD